MISAVASSSEEDGDVERESNGSFGMEAEGEINFDDDDDDDNQETVGLVNKRVKWGKNVVVHHYSVTDSSYYNSKTTKYKQILFMVGITMVVAMFLFIVSRNVEEESSSSSFSGKLQITCPAPLDVNTNENDVDVGDYIAQGHLVKSLNATEIWDMWHKDGVDHWNIETGWHTVVEETGVLHAPVVAVEVFLIQRPADALD